MDKPNKPASLLRKQLIMRRVVLATLPCIAGSVYFFGWRSLALVAVSYDLWGGPGPLLFRAIH